jgi:hypothetical protein
MGRGVEDQAGLIEGRAWIMTFSLRTVWLLRLALVVAVASTTTILFAASPDAKARQPDPSQAGETVEMFSAIKQGQIEVKLIPKDSTVCRVMIENKTTRPLTVQMPDAFAGVPVLAQLGGGMGGGGRRGGTGGMGGGQGFGGGMGGMGMGGMGMGGMGMGGRGMGGMGRGMFAVPPEKVAQADVPIVCLDHGKRDPRPKMKYEIKPIEEYTDKKAVYELARLLGNGSLNQRVAQAAAWHLNNDMSWQQLLTKELRFANGTRRPYFSRDEIRAAMQVATLATGLAEQRKVEPPKSSSGSSPSQQ